MLPFSYLVLGVNPVSNESNVELNKKITVSFAKHINPDTLNANTVRLRAVNGNLVDYTGKYNNLNKTYELTPTAPLLPNTQYQTMILGGVEGVVSIDASYIPTTKTYEFSTVTQESISSVTGLELAQDYKFAFAKWNMPEGLQDGQQVYFNVRLSASVNPGAADIWPLNALEGKTTSTSLTIPHRLEGNQSYFVHVQAVAGETVTGWTTGQIFIDVTTGEDTDEALPEELPMALPDEDFIDPSALEFQQLAIVDHFPAAGEMHKPEQVLVLFSDTIDPASVTESSFYIVEAISKQNLTLLDMKTAYSFKNALSGTIGIDPDSPNLLSFTPDGGAAAFREGKEYTVIVSKDLKGAGLTMGQNFSFSFTGTPNALYGDLTQIKETVSKYGFSFTNRFIQSLMRKHSQFAVDVWANSSTYDESLLADGAAPYFIHEYVNTQVLIDSILNGGSSASTAVGNETMKLGELSISKEAGAAKAQSMASNLELLGNQLKMWTDMIHGHSNRGYAKPVTAIKGESVAPYPDYLTRSTLLDFDA